MSESSSGNRPVANPVGPPEFRLSRWLTPFKPFINGVAAIRASVHVKLLSSFLIGALLLLGLGILNYGTITRMTASVARINDLHKKVDLANGMYYDITAQSHMRGMVLLTHDEQYNKKLDGYKKEFATRLDDAENLGPAETPADRLVYAKELDKIAQPLASSKDPIEVQRAQTLSDESTALKNGTSFFALVRAATNDFNDSSAVVLNLYRQNKFDQATTIHLTQEHPKSHVLEAQLLALRNKSNLDMAVATNAFTSDSTLLIRTAASAALVALVVALLLGMIMSWAFIRPVRQMDVALARIAGGDFSARVKVSNRDEFGTLAKNLNATAGQLSTLYGELQTLNAGLEGKVQEQLAQIERASGLRRYLSPQLADSIMSGNMVVGEKPRRRSLTVLFADLRDFTPISLKVEPDELVDMLNEYLTIMTDIVFKHGGTLDKYIGDAIMCFFGDPVPQEDHPQRAVSTALEMRAQVAELQRRWHVFQHPLNIGIGVSTGYVTVGNIGSPSRIEYTVIGNHVNLASRLSDRAKPGQILISERTMVGVQGSIEAVEVFNVRLQGVSQRLKVFEINERGRAAVHILGREDTDTEAL
jgi:class 3 adenylate cyclase/CHASE3 domain sensor protein